MAFWSRNGPRGPHCSIAPDHIFAGYPSSYGRAFESARDVEILGRCRHMKPEEDVWLTIEKRLIRRLECVLYMLWQCCELRCRCTFSTLKLPLLSSIWKFEVNKWTSLYKKSALPNHHDSVASIIRSGILLLLESCLLLLVIHSKPPWPSKKPRNFTPSVWSLWSFPVACYRLVYRYCLEQNLV